MERWQQLGYDSYGAWRRATEKARQQTRRAVLKAPQLHPSWNFSPLPAPPQPSVVQSAAQSDAVQSDAVQSAAAPSACLPGRLAEQVLVTPDGVGTNLSTLHLVVHHAWTNMSRLPTVSTSSGHMGAGLNVCIAWQLRGAQKHVCVYLDAVHVRLARNMHNRVRDAASYGTASLTYHGMARGSLWMRWDHMN